MIDYSITTIFNIFYTELMLKEYALHGCLNLDKIQTILEIVLRINWYHQQHSLNIHVKGLIPKNITNFLVGFW